MDIGESIYPRRDADYYQRFHDQDPLYQTNNWLLSEIETIRSFGAKSLLELACGNGRFLECAAPYFERVIGCDWAISPRMDGVLSEHTNVYFSRVDLYQDLPPFLAELVASADFLEHLAPEALPTVLRRIDSLSAKAFHKIACYDDGHSHLSIFTPQCWLDLFQEVNPAYRLDRVSFRNGDSEREIAVLSKGHPGGSTDHITGSFCMEVDGESSPAPTVLRLNFGCGEVRREGYLGVDVRPCAGADHCIPAWETGPFHANTVDTVYSRHMLEHLDPSDGARTLASWYRLLKPGGHVRLIVPDLAFHARQLLGQATSWDADAGRNLAHAMAGLYGWHDPQRGGKDTDAHRWGYTWLALSRTLQQMGFEAIWRHLSGEDSEPWHLHVTARKPS